MAEEVKNNNSKKPQIIAAIAVVMIFILGLLIFKVQDNGQAEQTSQTTEMVQAPAASSDAGSLGKYEVDLNDNNFAKDVLDYKGVFMVEFYLSTCPHCRNVASTVTAVSNKMVGKAMVGKIEASENETTANRYNVTGVPTFVIFRDGKEAGRVEGEQTKEQLLGFINKYLK